MLSIDSKDLSPLSLQTANQPQNPARSASLPGLSALPPSSDAPGLGGSQELTLAQVEETMAAYGVSRDDDLGSGGLISGGLVSSSFVSNSVILQASPFSPVSDLPIQPLSDGNNSLATAQDLDTLTGLRIQQGYVGGMDHTDYYRFELSGVRDVTLSLTGLGSDVDLRLIQDKNNNGQVDSGEVIAASLRSGDLNESLNKVLAGGTYFAQITKQTSSSSNYEFRSYAKLPEVTVDVTRIRALSSGIDFGSQADFYSKITIDGSTYTTGSVSNDNDISPNWSYGKIVDGTSHYVSIGIQVWDSDGGLAGGDDHVDIDAQAGRRDVNLWYNLLTNQISGDVSGSGGSILSSSGGGDSDRAQAWFKVTEGDWFDQNLGDDHLTNLARNAAYIDRQDMMLLLRETKDYGSVTGTELNDLRTLVEHRVGPESVENLAGKIVNGDVANSRSGIGNLYAGASATHMENLIGKWFLGNDRPDAAGTYSAAGGSLFRNGISYTDVDQGSLGDCYFLAALGAAAKDKSHVISNMFSDNGDGTFTVKFYKPDGSRDYVTVDRYLPTNGSGNFIYANRDLGLAVNSANNELWVALAEKAYAQVNESGWIGQDNTNSYGGIAFGWMDRVINQISGISTSSQNANDMTKTQLINLVNSNKMLTAGFVSGANYGVVNQHAYTLTAYNSATGTFRLHNPWGNSHADVTWEQLKDLQGVIQYSNA